MWKRLRFLLLDTLKQPPPLPPTASHLVVELGQVTPPLAEVQHLKQRQTGVTA